jgi:hypothetical protein
MRPKRPLSTLIATNPEETDPTKAQQGPLRPGSETLFVTRVTKLRGLLRAAREALKDGEAERMDRILAEALRELPRLRVVDS